MIIEPRRLLLESKLLAEIRKRVTNDIPHALKDIDHSRECAASKIKENEHFITSVNEIDRISREGLEKNTSHVFATIEETNGVDQLVISAYSNEFVFEESFDKWAFVYMNTLVD